MVNTKCMPKEFIWGRAAQAKAFAHYSSCLPLLSATPC